MLRLMVPRNYRVEFPAWGRDHAVCFEHEADARTCARQWSKEDAALVLVWSFAAAAYIGRYDGRGQVA